ncbi:hypothetical protein [Planktotalea sp.]|uniref:hypothetical protein n=1 Tax=Planktotalea sp. TaxID=2029877 RepID=UPI0035C80ABB
MSTLDAQLLAAHEVDDRPALVRLYQDAAQMSFDENAAGFYLTHAYIFALELGHADTPALHAKLKAMGRES